MVVKATTLISYLISIIQGLWYLLMMWTCLQGNSMVPNLLSNFYVNCLIMAFG